MRVYDFPSLQSTSLLAGLVLLYSGLFAACDSDCSNCEFAGINVDLLVAYTDSAKAESGTIGSYLEQAIDETNEVFANSDLDVRLRIAGTLEVSYPLTDRLMDLARLLDPNDGYLDEIHAERDRIEADIVILVTNRRTSTTNASIMATPETAFVIINRTDMGAPGYALAHEVGHLFGARHSADRDGAQDPFPYGHGFRNDSLRTVVANGSQTVIPYFSSPRARYEGVVLGDSASADVARVISTTAAFISNFRGSTTETSFVSPGTWPVLPD